jgi:hypothetical protein
VADLQRVLPYDDALDEQLQELLLLPQGRLLQPTADALAERLQVRPDFLGRTPRALEARQLLALGGEGLPADGDLLAALFQLLQVDDIGLVGVEQALLLALEAPHLPLPFLPLGPVTCLLIVGLAGERLELLQQRGGVVEQPLDVLPDRRVEFLGLRLPLRARVVPVPAGAVPAVAAVVAPPGLAIRSVAGHAEHGQATGPAGEQAAEQVVMPGVVPEG